MTGFCDLGQQLLILQPQLAQSGGKPDLPDKIRQSGNSCLCQSFLAPSFSRQLPDISGKPYEFLQSVSEDVPVIYRMEHRHSLAVIAVCIGRQLMFHQMALEIPLLSQLDQPVFRQSGIPEKIAPGRIVLLFLYRIPQIPHYIPHQCLSNIVRHIVSVRAAEIRFHNVRKAVECP